MNSDELYKPEFKEYINSFMEITSKDYKPHTIAPYVTRLATSNYIDMLMKNPKNEHIKSCIRDFLRQNKDVSSSFLNRLIAFSNIVIQPTTPYGLGQSANVSVCLKHVTPFTKKITGFTFDARREQLKDEILNSKEYISFNHYSNLLVDVRLKLDNTLLDNLLFSYIKLNHNLMDGARLNGFEPDSYVSRKLEIKSSLAG